jgi:hypothetical protein
LFVRLHFPQLNKSGCASKLTVAILNISKLNCTVSFFCRLNWVNNKYFPSQATFEICTAP